MTDHILVMCAAGNKINADQIASEIINNRLAACAQISKIESYYRWEDRVHHDPEFLILIKSKKEKFPQIEALIKQIHEYQLPEISVIQISGGSKEYLSWIDDSLA